MSDGPVATRKDEHEAFEAGVLALEAAEAFHRYRERLNHFVKTGEERHLVDESRHIVAALARLERWTPSVILKAIRRGCYHPNATPEEAGRHAEEVDRLLYAYYNDSAKHLSVRSEGC